MQKLAALLLCLFFPVLLQAQSWETLNKQVKQLMQEERFNEAVLTAELSVSLARKQYGEGPQLAVSLFNLAGALESNGDLEKPEAIYLQSLRIFALKPGENNPDYANMLRAFGMYCITRNQYSRADSLFSRSANILRETGSEQTANHARLLNSRGELLLRTNALQDAADCFEKAAAMEKTISGEQSELYTTYISNLANAYFNLSRYDKAEPLLLKVKEIRKNTIGEIHSQYAAILTSLAEYYTVTGQHEKAVGYFTEALGIAREVYGTEHLRFAVLVKKAADFALDMNQYHDAEMLYTKALSIFRKTTGEQSVEFGSCSNGMGLLYMRQQRYDEAIAKLITAKEIIRKTFNEWHPDYGASLNNLGLVYTRTGAYREAEKLFLQAGEIAEKRMGPYSQDYSTCLDNLVKLYTTSGQFALAEPLILQHNRIVLKNMQDMFTVLSGTEKELYLQNQLQVAAANHSFMYLSAGKSNSVSLQNFHLQLQLKSVALRDTRNMIAAVRQNTDTALHTVYSNWQNNKGILSKQYALPAAKRRTDLQNLEEQSEALEKELNRRSAAFRNQQQEFTVSAASLQQQMHDDEAVIEFVSFSLYRNGWTDSVLYAAYVLNKKDSLPVFVPLCEEKQLGQYFSPAGGDAAIKAIYRSDPVDEADAPALSGDSLYALIWKPLLPYLANCKTIHYSPSGLLNRIAFGALPAGNNRLLTDVYELNRYINLRQMVQTGKEDQAQPGIALFGNCRYAAGTPENAGTGWKELPGTAAETDSIRALFLQQNRVAALYQDQSATEEKLKALSGTSPAILHLATHGFFLADPAKRKQEGFAADERNAFTMAADPLLRSGLVLSGANRVWLGGQPLTGKEDGIVTAYEIAQLDLGRTGLVVLSACNTAMGDIRGTEGVFGLQRAFKLAGVQKMILSLWKVPDEATAELMKLFYQHYLQGKTARVALKDAQSSMRKKYPPYYWAAFVLIE